MTTFAESREVKPRIASGINTQDLFKLNERTIIGMLTNKPPLPPPKRKKERKKEINIG